MAHIPNLKEKYGNYSMILSTANVISHDKIMMTLNEYIDNIMIPFTLQNKADDSWYLFGDNKH